MSDILKIFQPCDACQGAGVENGEPVIGCETCGGTGRSDKCLFLSQDLIDLLNDMNTKLDDISELVSGG